MSDEPGRDRERHLQRAGDRSREATGADRCTRRPPAAAAAIRRESSVARAESPSARAQSVGALPGVHRAARAASPTRVRRPATRLPGVCGPERRRRLTPATRASRLATANAAVQARAPGPRRANTGHSARPDVSRNAGTATRTRDTRHWPIRAKTDQPNGHHEEWSGRPLRPKDHESIELLRALTGSLGRRIPP
jgi:hypothetical protein